MSFTRVKPSNWSIHEKLTSNQMNQLDTDHANAVDKTGDSLAGILAVNNGTAIISVSSSGSIQVGNGGVYTATAGSSNLYNNCNIDLFNNAQLNFYTGSDATFNSGSTLTCDGSVTLSSVVNYGSLSVANFSGNVNSNVGSTWLLNGPITINGATTLAGTTTISGATTASNFTISGTNKVKLASRSITRTFGLGVPYTFIFNDGISDKTWTTFQFYQGIATQSLNYSKPNATYALNIELDLPHNSVLNSLNVRYLPAIGHAVLPNLPTIRLTRTTIASGASTNLFLNTDSSLTVPDYEVLRSLTISGISETINNTIYKYTLTFESENGPDVVNGLRFYGGTANYTVTEYDDG